MTSLANFFGGFLAFYYVAVCVGDHVSIGVSTCTKLDNEGRTVEFLCPNSLSLSEHYCCGVKNFQYCCDYDEREAFSEGAVAAIVIGMGLILFCVLGTICWCCSCCCFARRQPQHIFITQPLASATTIHQPLFASPGYSPLGNGQNLQASGPSQYSNPGYNAVADSIGKPPPYAH